MRPTTPPARRLRLEPLEPRLTPAHAAAAVVETDLVADQPGKAALTDPNLVNGWGISLDPTGGDFWVSARGTGVSTTYGGDVGGTPLSVVSPVVTVPGGTVTGQVFNPTGDFIVRSGSASAPAQYLFATEAGQISGWSPAVEPSAALPAVSGQAVYKGLAIGGNSQGNFLFAADFLNNKIDVFDKAFAPARLAGNFTDPNLPAGYGPFNVQDLGGKLYVTYARHLGTPTPPGGYPGPLLPAPAVNPSKDDHAPGAGLVDVFDTDGHFLKRLVSNGELNAPWGLAVAPAGFGGLGGDLLVGNFGDGRVLAYDPTSGEFKGELTDAAGRPVVIPGLWGMTFGNGVTAGDKNALYFAAGPATGTHGLFGSLRATTPTHPRQRLTAVGADAGGGPRVTVFDPETGQKRFDFFAFEPQFTGGARVATGDVDGDGVADVIVAAGAGGGPRVAIFSGATGQPIRTFFAFEPNFTGGVQVASGDVNGDGIDDVVIGAGLGGAPRVRVFDGKDGSVLEDFFAYDSSFRNGVQVAAGDTDGDGTAEVITGAGVGGGPQVNVFRGTSGAPAVAFFALDPSSRGGVSVAAGDMDGDGKAEIIAGPAAGGSAVSVFDDKGGRRSSFAAFDPAFTGGVRLAAGDVDGDGRDDILVGPGRGGGPDVRVRGDDGRPRGEGDFFAFEPSVRSGVFVG